MHTLQLSWVKLFLFFLISATDEYAMVCAKSIDDNGHTACHFNPLY